MSSSGLDPGAPKAAEDVFEDVWKHLGELHRDAVQGRDLLAGDPLCMARHEIKVA